MTMNRNQYPCVEFDLDKLVANLAALVERCHDSLIEVAGVVKAVSSLPEIVRVYEESGVKFIATSRISQMRAIREAGICKKPLMLIRIPMLSELPDVVELCDISLQSDIIVLRALNEEAKKQGKVHEVILMMDLGDLREGFWNEEDALDAALEIEHELKNLRLAGVGVNLSCYGSVLPTKRNMQGLVSLASDIEREIGRKLDYIRRRRVDIRLHGDERHDALPHQPAAPWRHRASRRDGQLRSRLFGNGRHDDQG